MCLVSLLYVFSPCLRLSPSARQSNKAVEILIFHFCFHKTVLYSVVYMLWNAVAVATYAPRLAACHNLHADICGSNAPKSRSSIITSFHLDFKNNTLLCLIIVTHNYLHHCDASHKRKTGRGSAMQVTAAEPKRQSCKQVMFGTWLETCGLRYILAAKVCLQGDNIWHKVVIFITAGPVS